MRGRQASAWKWAGALATFIMVVCLWSLPGAAGQVVDRIVAVVGNDVITSMDLAREIERLKASMERMRRRGQIVRELPPEQLKALALERLIDEKLFEQEVKRLKIRVSPREVDAYIERLKRSGGMDQAQLLAYLNRQGLTLNEYRARIKKDLLKQKLIAREVKSRVVISDADVERYIRAHHKELAASGRFTFQAIFFTLPKDATPAQRQALRQQAENVRKMALEGKDFGELARTYSDGPAADKGGVIGPVEADELLGQMRVCLGQLKPGQVGPVVELPNGYVVLKLLKREGPGKVNEAQLKEEIRRKLERQALDKRFREWLRQLRARTYIRIIEH